MDAEIVPLIILMGFVLPLWIVFHYITKWKKDKNITPEDEHMLTDLRRNAEKLEQRLISMERILDEEVPDWRSRRHDPL